MDRTKSLGGSDMAAVMGLSRYRSPLQVFLEKTGVSDSFEGNRFTYWGEKLEDLVAKEFSLKTGKRVYRRNSPLIHSKYDFITGNIDRRVAGEGATIECKTASQFKASDWDGTAPQEYIIQLQHYLMLTGDEFGYFAVLIGGNDFRYFQMARDESLISKIEESAFLFWNNHILTGTPPEPTALDHDILNSKYSTPSDNLALLDADFDVLCEEYLSASKAESHFKNIKNDISAKLKGLIGNDIGGKAVVYQAKWSRFDRKTIDSDTLQLEMPEIAEKYTKTTKSGCIRVSKVK